MALIISANNEYQKSNIPTGFQPVVINNEDEAFEIVSNSDWVAPIFRDGHRKIENFMEAVAIAIDIDKTTASRMSLDEFKQEFKDTEYWVFTSRNHGKEKVSGKDTYLPADRYHAVFPLSYSIKTPHEYREFIEAMIDKYPCIDKGAKDGARFFFGFHGTEVTHNAGKCLEKPEVKKRRETFQDRAPIDESKRKSEILELLKRAANSGCLNDRTEWISCGMAMKACSYSFEEWMDLSWDTERERITENRKRWEGFTADKHTKGTLLRFARMADPGFMVKKYYSSNTFSSADHGDNVSSLEEESISFLAMPWERWYQPHVVVTTKKDPITKEMFDVHTPKATIENFEAMLSFYRINILENLMTRDIEIVIPGLKKTEGKSENSNHGTILSLCVLNGFAVGNIDAFIPTVAHKKAYHPVRDWFSTLEKWDGIDRVQAILDTILEIEYQSGAEKLPKVLLTKWLVSCVAAVMAKSYRGRGVLTFQGAQEIGKTSFFRSIVPSEHFESWFKDGVHVDTKDKDSIKRVISHWIVELGEIEGMFKKEISSLKAFITSDEDILRLPYERKAEKYPRRTIMCATVNDPNFLNDPTGSSRFWVITAKSIRYNHDLDIRQLWAQALEHYASGMSWWLEGIERDWLTISNANFYDLDTHSELIRLKYDLDQLKMEQCKTRIMLTTEIVLELGLRAEPKETRATAKALRMLGVKEGYCYNRSKGFVMPPLRSITQFGSTDYPRRYAE